MKASEDEPSTGGTRHLTWLGILAIGWVLYELTARPAVGAAAVCVKFGWEDFRAAIWLRRRDPWPTRGRVCFWVYLASGLWKTALAAFFMTVGFIILAGHLKPAVGRAGPLLEAILATLVANGVSLAFAGLTLLYGLVLALRRGIRVWLGTAAHEARRRNCWPPGQRGTCGANLLQSVAMSMVYLLGIPLIPTMAYLSWVVLDPWLPRRAEALGIVGPSVLWMATIGMLILICKQQLEKRLIADWPRDCWGIRPPEGSGAAHPAGLA
jgi:hypothetical protein